MRVDFEPLTKVAALDGILPGDWAEDEGKHRREIAAAPIKLRLALAG